MSTLDTTTAAAVLKTYYSKQRVTSLTYKDAPLYAMLDKITDFYGSSYPLPSRVTAPQGRSATFANAQAQKIASNYKTFSLTRVRDYSLASISNEAIMASENDAGAFLRLATAEIDGALESLKRSISWSLYGDGSGALGQVSATTTGATAKFTLVNVEDIGKIEVGQTLNVWSATSGGSQRNIDGSITDVTVKSVDRDLGTFTINETTTGSKTIAANDYLFVKGDRGAKLSGLAGWIPATAPTAGDSWFGVDRSIDATRLGGVRVTCTGKPQDEALVDAARRMGREGGDPDTVFTPFTRYASLEKTMGARVRYKDFEVGGVGFRGMEISGPKKSMLVVPDRDCPANNQYMLTMNSWGLYSLKEPIQLLDSDGNKMLREGTADANEVRVGGYMQVGCTSPKDNAVLIY